MFIREIPKANVFMYICTKMHTDGDIDTNLIYEEKADGDTRLDATSST